jgi:hypothetical protein
MAAFALAAPASASAYTTGVGDQHPEMFASPFYTALHTKIARYIAPYDVADVPGDLAVANSWIASAEAQGIQPLIAFYHSRTSPTRLPSLDKYTREIKKFMALHPEIKTWSPWNEANRGNVPGLFRSPSAQQAAQFYLALRKNCSGCTIVGLDVLDSQNINATVRYIKQFQKSTRRAQPKIWGLHNYSDTNRFRNKGTKAVLKAVKGQVWLTETGGVVKFGGAFPNRHGEGVKRAAKALTYMFSLARSNKRIARLYIFQWTGGDTSIERFDAGLIDQAGKPRDGYFVVRKQLTGR